MNYSHLNCSMPPWYWDTTENAFRTAYYILPPIAVPLAIISRLMCVFALRRQAMKEVAYTYQMVLVSTELIQMIASAFYTVSIGASGLSGAPRQGNAFFTSSYICMWYRARLAAPLLNAFVTTTLLLSVSMAADRVFALAQPYAYRLINHGRHRGFAVVVSFVFGMSTSTFDIFRAKVASTGSPTRPYSIVHDPDFVGSLTLAIFSHVRNFVRVASLITLIGLNSMLIYFYHVRVRRVQRMSLLSTGQADKKKEEERNLILLTVYQSVSSTVVMTFLTIFYVLFYSSGSVRLCGRFLLVPILDCVCKSMYAANIFVILAINRPFRRIVKRYWTIGRRFSV